MTSPLTPTTTNKQTPAAPTQTPTEVTAALGHSIEDEIVGEAGPFYTFLKENTKAIIVGTLLVIAIIIGSSFYKFSKNSDFTKSSIALGKILVKPHTPAKVAELEAFLTNAPDFIRSTVLLELATVYTFDNNHAKAADAWNEIAKINKDFATTSKMKQAYQLISNNDFPQAAEAFKDASLTVKDEDRNALLIYAAETFAAAQQNDKALALFQEVLNSGFTDDVAKNYIENRITVLSKENL